jgi:hypothetical protein
MVLSSLKSSKKPRNKMNKTWFITGATRGIGAKPHWMPATRSSLPAAKFRRIAGLSAVAVVVKRRRAGQTVGNGAAVAAIRTS